MNENEIIEEWKPIEGYENYQVSNLGRVKSLNYNNTKQEKILSQVKKDNGYLYVNLYKKGKSKNFRVHRLVANAFIPNYNNYTCVNHKDENKENNCVDNLEWCDVRYNTNYGTAQQRRVASTDYQSFQAKRVASTDWKRKVENTDYKTIAEKQSNQLYQYTKDGILVAIWQSTRDCGRNGFEQSAVSKCCNGKLKSHRGFIWSYTPL